MDTWSDNLIQWATAVAKPGVQTTWLLAGLAALVIVLLVLMRTRWGQAKPLSKCMVLSIVVHLLLVVYAYFLQTFVAVPIPGRDQIVHVSLMADIEEEEFVDLPTEQPVEQEPWNDFVAVQPLDAPPEPTAPVPTPIDQPLEPPRERAPAPVPMAAPELPDLPDVTPDHPLPLPLPLDHTAVRPLQPDPETMLDREPSVAPQVDPQQPELFRADEPAGLVRVDESMVPSQDVPAELPLDLVAGMTAIPQMIPDTTPMTTPIRQLTQPETVARRTADGSPLPAAYRNRTAENRGAIVVRGGGNAETEAAVQAALAWLAANQDPDGRWNARRHGAGHETQVLGHDRGGAGSDADTGISGLALLAFLGSGQSHLEGEYIETVRRGLEFLMRSQTPDGNLAGNARLFARMYCHGMAALAISEAYAMTGDARLRPYVERAMRYTIRAQNPNDGGWRYLPGDSGDTSQFGWQLMALKSAELGGIAIPDAANRGMRRFLESVSTGRHGGLAAYRPHGPPTVTMTAEALLCRLFLDPQQRGGEKMGPAPRENGENLGKPVVAKVPVPIFSQPQSDAAILEAVELLMQETPRSGDINLYYWYYATIALFQLQGAPWETWNQHLQERLLATQVTTGPHAGSWPTKTVWGGYGGRVYTTAMAALCLEVYYRYLPLFESPRP
jgi:hypothetical protein